MDKKSGGFDEEEFDGEEGVLLGDTDDPEAEVAEEEFEEEEY